MAINVKKAASLQGRRKRAFGLQSRPGDKKRGNRIFPETFACKTMLPLQEGGAYEIYFYVMNR